MKLIVRTPRPRNPLATAARMRQAGAHHRGIGGLRQRARRDLQRELQHEHPPST